MWALSSDMAYSQIFAPLAKALPNLFSINSATSLSSKNSKLALESSGAASSAAGCGTRQMGMNTSL